jgi:hypothetical protein
MKLVVRLNETYLKDFKLNFYLMLLFFHFSSPGQLPQFDLTDFRSPTTPLQLGLSPQGYVFVFVVVNGGVN